VTAPEVHVWAISPPLSPPNEMMAVPPAALSEFTCEVKAPTASPLSSHSGVQPDCGIRKASV
jgi:hypothetical protein